MQRHADIDEDRSAREGASVRSLTYCLITPARNEEAFIEATIRAVAGQTVLPLRWVIVSDGSTDRTDAIVQRYAEQHRWIDYVRIPERQGRDFAGKVRAFNAGYQRIESLQFDVVGNLDADISFGDDYFSFLLRKFEDDPGLGVAGTPFTEQGHRYDYRYTSINHVSGACQLFRRPCFESIGGYQPIRDGGIDLVAVTTARKQGWTTRSFVERECIHHRAIGTGKSRPLAARFRFGKQDYYLGSHPLWELVRSIYQLRNRPYVFGGLCLLAGYTWACASGQKRRVPDDFVRFRRAEQIDRLKNFCRRRMGLGGSA